MLPVAAVMFGVALPSAEAQLVPTQVADIRPGGAGSEPGPGQALGAQLIFAAESDPSTGFEPHVSDGTAAGTTLLKDINPGPGSSDVFSFTVLGDVLYFGADDGTTGSELWRTDGTATGTVQVKDINLGADDSSIRALTAFKGLLFFSANDGLNGSELWRSDGTDTGTTMVKNINAAGGAFFDTQIVPFGDFVYFGASDGANGEELWRSDGTDAGTTPVKNIGPAGASGLSTGTFDPLVVFAGQLYFAADDGATGRELWRSDGTDAGTVPVKDINPAGASSPREFAEMGGILYFSAADASGAELWRTDGSAAGTIPVADVNSGPESSFPSDTTALNGVLLFTADDNPDPDGFDAELWRSDGTAAGTVKLSEITAGGFENPFINSLTVLGDSVYFSASDEETGSELWRSDGTTEGTTQVADINPGSNDSEAGGNYVGRIGFARFQDTLYFPATSPAGRELWRLSEPPAVDATAPVLTLETPGKKKLKRNLNLGVSCDEACEISGSGTVVAKPAKKGQRALASRAKKQRFKLSGPPVSLAAGAQGALTLSLSKKSFKKAKKAKREGAKLKAQITITASDAANNASDQPLKLKLG
ncbi:MAG TPA: ELWxxDGT repeat protein [Ilumatobacteraceae bacterium]|nr:ELWxxDGT repeat protein [Ilumatobacteraceae bacterium]